MTEIRGRRVLLRPTRDEDLPSILAWQNHPEIARWMDYDRTFTLEEVRTSEARAREEGHPFVIEVDGRAIGRIGLNGFRERDGVCALYVFIGEADVDGRHLGREAILALLGWAFADLGVRLVELWGLAGNARALHTYERCGFRREAVLRERSRRADGWFEDHVVMSVTRPEFETARDAFVAATE